MEKNARDVWDCSPDVYCVRGRDYYSWKLTGAQALALTNASQDN